MEPSPTKGYPNVNGKFARIAVAHHAYLVATFMENEVQLQRIKRMAESSQTVKPNDFENRPKSSMGSKLNKTKQMRDIEELKKHMNELAGKADEQAWMIFLSFIRRKNLNVKEYRLKKFQEFIQYSKLEGDEMESIFEAIISRRDKLLNAQDALEEVLSELMNDKGTNEMMQKYESYEQLRLHYMNVMGQIPVDEAAAAEAARQKRRVLLDSIR